MSSAALTPHFQPSAAGKTFRIRHAAAAILIETPTPSLNFAFTSPLSLSLLLSDFLLRFRVKAGYGNIWSVHNSVSQLEPGGG